MRLSAFFAALLLAAAPSLPAQVLQPITTNNSDSCDIALTPAATLLLPYFEVDTNAQLGAGTTTLFTVGNASPYPQIAHVTIWTDWAYPVLAFNLFLTGYDVQGINLFDTLVRGIVVPGQGSVPSGTSMNTIPGKPYPAFVPARGSAPLSNSSNPNFVASGANSIATTCASLPGALDSGLVKTVKDALTVGIGGGTSCSPALRIGSNTGHRAKGYITVDVVSYCTAQFPTDANGGYFAGPNAALLFDNVLFGDYQQIGPSPAVAGSLPGFDAQGNAMVHIHAVPEGGLSGAGGGVPVATNLPFTFYDRYTPDGARIADRRQPLPSTWIARTIQGGTGAFSTDLKIWREGITRGLPSCSTSGVQLNSAIALDDIIRFDEHENSMGLGPVSCPSLCIVPIPNLPATSRTSVFSSVYPHVTGTDLGGWLYLNLNSLTRDGSVGQCHSVLSAQRPGFTAAGCGGSAPAGTSGSRTTSQNWVIASMFGTIGTNRLSVDLDALALGNGCTPAPLFGAQIAPATQRNGLVCPAFASCAPGTVRAPMNP